MTVLNHAIQALALRETEKQVAALVKKYAEVKSGPSSLVKKRTQEILAAVYELEKYLNELAWPKKVNWLTAPKTSVGAMDYAMKMAEAEAARYELFRIESLQFDDELPQDPISWTERRARLSRQRTAMIRLGVTMRQAIRRMDGQIAQAGEADYAIRRAAADPVTTKEEIVLLDQDWKDWVAAAEEARRWRDAFEYMLHASKNSARILAKMIEAGDRAQE